MNFRAGIFKVNKPHREFFQAISKTLTDVYIAYNFIIWIAVICISPKGAIFFRRTSSCIPYAYYILKKPNFFGIGYFFQTSKKNFFGGTFKFSWTQVSKADFLIIIHLYFLNLKKKIWFTLTDQSVMRQKQIKRLATNSNPIGVWSSSMCASLYCNESTICILQEVYGIYNTFVWERIEFCPLAASMLKKGFVNSEQLNLEEKQNYIFKIFETRHNQNIT